MSNMTLFSNNAALPAHLQRRELSETTKALMGNTNKRISIEGGVFRLVAGGQEIAAKEERHMNVIVLRAADNNSRTFYQGTYVKGSKAKPACWSDDSVSPHADVKTPQSDRCATCPQNIKGSGQGENTRACRFQRRLAVLLDNDINGDIYAMSVPAASVFDNANGREMGLQQYARFLGGHGVDINAVVTKLKFDTSVSSPKLLFSAERPLEETEFATVIARREDQAAIDAVTMTVGQLDDVPETPAENPAPAAPVQAPPPPVAAAPATIPKPTKAPAGFTVTKAVPVVQETAEESPAAPPVVRTAAAPAVVPNVSSILSDWGTDADD